MHKKWPILSFQNKKPSHQQSLKTHKHSIYMNFFENVQKFDSVPFEVVSYTFIFQQTANVFVYLEKMKVDQL